MYVEVKKYYWRICKDQGWGVDYNQETDQSLQGTRQNNVEASLNEIALFFGLTVDLNQWDYDFEIKII